MQFTAAFHHITDIEINYSVVTRVLVLKHESYEIVMICLFLSLSDDQYSYARRAYPANGHLPNSHHRDEWINGQIPTDPPPSYDPYDRPIGDYYNHRARPMGVEEQNMKNYYNNGKYRTFDIVLIA